MLPEHTARARAVTGPDKWLCLEQKVLLVIDPSKAREVASGHGVLPATDQLPQQLETLRF
jgi:hypothetical protein